MQAIAGIGWRGTAFDIMYIGTRSSNNQCPLELAHVLCINTEVGLQGNLDMHALWHIHETTTAPDSAVQRSKLVIRWRNDCAKVLLHEVWIQAQSSIHISKDNANLLKIFTHFVIDGLALILSSHACQELTLGLGNTQAIKCIFNLNRNVFPCFTLFLYRLDVIENVVEVNSREVSAPGWHWTFLKEIQALEAELAHPIGLALHLGDLLNNFAVQSSFGL